ncbi:tetraspanin 36 [Thalassophryne amazonica]|uniref:tetraspanin 36 n=1 Tax=Thalassophryne amazonica TaxID=390379 RepID=UPI0014722DBF|nr:tetraspanin 36 [Thalassophryne amazonica]
MDCGITLSKLVLLLLSLVFWAAGASLAYVGGHMISSYSTFSTIIDDRSTLVPAGIIIGVSVVVFIFGLVGCCATLQESKVGLGCFFLIILLIFAAEVAALVCGLIYQGKIKENLERSMNKTFMNYNGQKETKAVDDLQTQLQCCGIYNASSWATTPWFNSHNNTVPLSCCKNRNNTACIGKLNQPDLLYEEGCEGKLEQFLQSVLVYAMLVILGCALFKFLGMVSVCVITCRSSSLRSGYQPLYA